MTAGEVIGGVYSRGGVFLSRTPPEQSKWGSLTTSSLKAIELANSPASSPGGALLLALKKEAACHRVANDQRSAVAVASAKRRRRPKSSGFRRLLRGALERGQLTDCSYTLLMDLVVESSNTTSSAAFDDKLSTSWISTVDLDDLTSGDENDEATTGGGDSSYELESDILWQAEALYRKQQYKRRRLPESKALGLAAGLDCNSPFDHTSGEDDCCSTVVTPPIRQLRPLKSRGDPNMPGFVRRLFIQNRQFFDAESAQVCCWSAEAAPQKRCDLYRRLVRALDQRAAPADRLFRTSSTTKQSASLVVKSPTFAPSWLRPSVSKRLYSRGTSLFPK